MLTRWFDWGDLDWARSLAELDTLRTEMDRLFADIAPVARTRRAPVTSFPRIGLFDAKEQLVLRAELPGVAENDLEITVADGVLSLRGTRKVESPQGYTVHRQERPETAFARSFSLPCKVDADKANATLKNGVLTMMIPKAPEVKPRQITVKAT